MTKATPYSLPLTHQLAILVFSAFYFVHWFVQPLTAVERALQLMAFAAFLLSYFVAFNAPRLTLVCALFMVALAFVVAPYNHGSNTFAIYACSFFAYHQPPRRALLLIALTLLTLLASALLYHLHLIFYFGISAVMIFGLGFSGMIDRQRMEHQRKEQRSQEEIQRLAKIAERERISRDLHDVVGHSLTGIHLQAQLALKHLEQHDSRSAKEQCSAVATLARSALQEIRATLADLKKQSLAEELQAQQQFLSALDVEFSYDIPTAALPQSLENELIFIIRELVTNTLRHSHGSAVCLRIAGVAQELELHYGDNGKGIADFSEQSYGNGLRGIVQRVQRCYGILKLYNDPGLNVRLTLPWSGP